MQIDREEVEAVTDFILLGSKVTEDDNCNHKIKRRLFLEGKNMTNLDSILKSRDITLLIKVCIVKVMVMVFPVVTYGASLVAQLVENPHAMQKTPAQFLGWEDPLEVGMVTHSSILVCMDRDAWQATVHGVGKSQTQLSH